MSNTIYFHNLTKQIVNMTELESVALSSDPDDVIMCSKSGNAMLTPLDSYQQANIIEYRLWSKPFDEENGHLQIKQS